MTDVAVKSFQSQLVAGYALNIIGDGRFFFRRLMLFLDNLKLLVLVWVYGITTLVGYLILNSIYIYIKPKIS